jgi:hypothetical protein
MICKKCFYCNKVGSINTFWRFIDKHTNNKIRYCVKCFNNLYKSLARSNIDFLSSITITNIPYNIDIDKLRKEFEMEHQYYMEHK